MTTISKQEAFDDLTGTVCKGCGGPKKSMMSHCRRCYFSLPPKLRKALYKWIGSGYEEAYTESLAMLKGERP